MSGRAAFVVFAAAGVLAWSGPARAQVVPVAACSACSSSDFEAFMRLGPTFIGAVSLTEGFGGLTPGGVFRLGTLAGLPIQVEATLVATLGGSPSLAGGVRLVPLGYRPGEGLVLGGGEGVNVGMIAGMNHAATLYLGPVVEFMLFREFGVVAEWVFPVGGALRAMPSVNLGLKFAFPRLREEAWR